MRPDLIECQSLVSQQSGGDPGQIRDCLRITARSARPTKRGLPLFGSNNVSSVNTTFLVKSQGAGQGSTILEGFRLQIHGKAWTLTAGAGATGIQESSVQGRGGVVARAERNLFCGCPSMLLPTSGAGPGAPAGLTS